MGGIASAVPAILGGNVGSSAVGGGLGAIGGQLNGALSPFGLGGQQGEYYTPITMGVAQQRKDLSDTQSPDFQKALSDYANGTRSSQSFQDMGMSNEAQRNALATGSMTGSKYATEQVQNNPILGQLFGDKGALTGALNKEQELQNQGFQLTPQDREAYGQSSGDIARLFGQSENGLTQSLANRGLAAAGSGSAGAQFSGLMGNKNEQLAKAQTDIANQRMQNTMGRIAQQQQYITGLGNQAQGAIQQQYGRQLSGAQNYQGNLNSLAQNENAANNAQLQSEEDKRKAAGKTLFGAIGQGVYNGVSGGTAGGVSSGISGAMMAGA